MDSFVPVNPLGLPVRQMIAAALPLLFLLGLAMSLTMPSASFYLLPARAWELSLGVALAVGVVPSITSRLGAATLSWVGLAFVVTSFVIINDKMTFPGWVALFPCVGTALIIYAARHDRGVGKILALPWMRYVGLISYSLYLWHWPIFVFLRNLTGSSSLSNIYILFGLALSFFFASLTHKFVETPFRSRSSIGNKNLIISLFSSSVVVIAFSSSLIYFRGLPDRMNDKAEMYLSAAQDVDNFSRTCANSEVLTFDGAVCRIGKQGVEVSFVLVGDSHAAALSPAFDRWAKESGVSGVVVWRGACPMFLGAWQTPDADAAKCTAFKNEFFSALERSPNIKTVFLGGRWTAAFTGHLPESGGAYQTLLVDSEDPRASIEDSKRVFVRSLKRSIQAINRNGADAIVIGPTPEAGFDVPRLLALGALNGRSHDSAVTIPAKEARDALEVEAVLRRVVTTKNTNGYISIREAFCDPKCLILRDGKPIFHDDDHLTATASNIIVGDILLQSELLRPTRGR